MTEEYDVLVIGGGPAGLTAAIYSARAELDTIVLDKPGNILGKVGNIDNYFGFPGGVSGGELISLGKEQAEKFGAEIREQEALSIEWEEETYLVETAEESYRAEGLILAPGIKHEKPAIDNLEEFEGRGVSYCVVCDAPFFKGRKTGILGAKNYAAKEALQLLDFTDHVTIFTDGEDLEVDEGLKEKLEEGGVPIVKEKVRSVKGEENLQALVLEDGEVELDGLFVAVGTSGSVDFARTLGIPIEDDSILVDEDLSTDLPRLYAAGDCTGGNRQIAIAVGEGSKAALNLIEEIRGEEYVDW